MKYKLTNNKPVTDITEFPLSSSSQKLHFQKLPVEIQLKILSDACRHSEPIRPKLFSIDLNTFSQQSFSTHENARITTYTQLSLSNKHFENLVAGDRLFYKANSFVFAKTASLVDYLSALPTASRCAIRNLSVAYDYGGFPRAAFTILSACWGLCFLELDISNMAPFLAMGTQDIRHMPGFEKLLCLRGLKDFRFGYRAEGKLEFLKFVVGAIRKQEETPENLKHLLVELRVLETSIRETVTLPRGTLVPTTPGELLYAMTYAKSRSWSHQHLWSLEQPCGIDIANDMSVNKVEFDGDLISLTDQQKWAIEDHYRSGWDS